MVKADTQLSPATQKYMLRTFVVLVICVLFFATMHLTMEALDFSAENDWLINLFDMDHEGNLPTWFASVLWLATGVSAMICFFVERTKSATRASFIWLLIGAAFIFASADEIASIHENVGSFLQSLSANNAGSVISVANHLQSSPNSPWIIYYLPVLILFGAICSAFLWSRFRYTRLFLVLVFLTVDAFALAIAMDHMQGIPREAQIQLARNLHMTPGMMLDWSIVIEESLEDLGCTFLILCFGGYALQGIEWRSGDETSDAG